MRSFKLWMPLVLLSALVAGGAADEEIFRLPPETVELKAAPGVDQIKGNCLLCHSVDYISTQPKLTRGQWTAAIEKMRGKYGAPIMSNQVAVLVDYLTKNYGKENPPKP